MPTSNQGFLIGNDVFVVMGVPAFTREGRRYTTFAEIKHAEFLVATELAKRGLVSGSSFVFLRKALALTATEVAALLRRRLATIARWESGETPVNRVAWVALMSVVAERFGGRRIRVAPARRSRSLPKGARSLLGTCVVIKWRGRRHSSFARTSSSSRRNRASV